MRTLILFALLSAPAAAQSFNIDVGENFGCCYPVPASTYVGAASQAGVWNASIHPYSTALVNLGGGATTATTSSNNAGWYNYFPSPLIGDDYNLMVDIQNLPNGNPPTLWNFSGLQNGDYAVYTYAWAPDSVTARTRVTVAGSVDPAQQIGGAWAGSPHVVGITYALHHVTVTAGTFSVQVEGVASSGSVNAFQLVFTPGAGGPTPFCLGDGTGAACPCGNNGSIGNGCANSSFAAGGNLAASGNAGASAGTDTLVLTAMNIPGPGLFFQANGLLGSPLSFGDGQLCAGVGIIRMGVVFPTGSTAAYPGGLTPNPIHIAGAPIASGDVRHYQCWYRDAVSFCTIDTFNLTNGVTLTWGP